MELFITFFIIGLFSIGGGYVMIPMIKEKCIEQKKWLTEEEFLDLLAVSESTPGPIAINLSTYIGYKKDNLKGAIISTFAVVFPSFIILYLISLFFNDLTKITIIRNAFYGIRIGVGIIIIRVAINMLKKECSNSKNKLFSLVIFSLFTVVLIITAFFEIHITAIEIIVASFIFAFIMIVFKKYDNI